MVPLGLILTNTSIKLDNLKNFLEANQYILLLFLLTWSPDREVWLNHEVVMFQPRTGTFLYLGSVTIVNLISSLSRPTYFKSFLGLHFFPWTYSYHPSIWHRLKTFHSLCCTHFPPQKNQPGVECPSTCTSPQPVSLH